MAINLDTALGTHATALMLRARRAEVLATNIAHADTPNYKARDIDFASALNATSAKAAGELVRTDPRHLNTAGATSDAVPELLYRIPQQPSIDGNTVDIQTEQAEFGRNALQYQASLKFLSGRIRTLLSAIRGD